MRALSAFQTLPWQIIDSVVDYYLDKDFCFCDIPKSIAAAIPHSCHSWRTIFVIKACEQLTLYLHTSDDLTYPYHKWPRALGQPNFPTSHLVKCINFHAPQYTAYAPNIWDSVFIHSPHVNFTFPQAHTLVINVGGINFLPHHKGALITIMVHNVASILRKVKQMTPAVCNIDIKWNDNVNFQLNEGFKSLIESTLPDVYDDEKWVHFYDVGCDPFSAFLVSTDFANITSIKFTGKYGHAQVIECTCRNAAWLRELSISFLPRSDAIALLYDGQGAPIVYSSLELINFFQVADCKSGMQTPIMSPTMLPTLAPTSISSPTPTLMPVTPLFKHFVHFPYLKTLEFNDGYPFSDDVLFRGNSCTLEKLTIVADSAFVDMAIECQFFSTNQFPNLERIDLAFDLPELDYMPFVHPKIKHCLLQILSAASFSSSVRRLSLEGILSDNVFLQAVKRLSLFSSVDTIILNDYTLRFAEIVTILRHTPCLRSLRCQLSNERPAIDGWSGVELVDYMHTVGDNFGRYFMSIDIGYVFYKEYAAECIALLAISCPLLSRFDVGNVYKDELYSELRRIATSELFSRYANRLQWFNIDW
ncbi:hypothetical protein BX661DRAFT_38439 [Kickxella alabastrina]|uniref:uncharacterized protein n=1 Tax=Kickxella alabastrina TaxID=61397 RepID=UPI00222129B7|nr:uncharacterized protein BX661DRAFT_38439 [Kickxella alabastrina]KAI7825445.1 hypothetical protein BX661DRAFT_38439 [Kickxella alabastrina]